MSQSYIGQLLLKPGNKPLKIHRLVVRFNLVSWKQNASPSILTVWRSCWGRSPRVTPDGAPCWCTPLSCRTAGFSHRFSSVHHMICNRMTPPSCRRRRRAAKSQTTATDPPSCSHATRKPQQHRRSKESSGTKQGRWAIDTEYVSYEKVTWNP